MLSESSIMPNLKIRMKDLRIKKIVNQNKPRFLR